MKKSKLIAFCCTLFTLCIVLNSCKSSEERSADKIASMEKSLNADSTKIPDKTEVVNLIDLYAEFSEKYPESEKTPDYLFSAGRYCMSYNLSTKAVEFFDKIIVSYPEYSKHPDSYFLKAFVYDSQLSNLPLARKSYEELIEKYPNHELALQARQLINILGKNLEDVVAGFQEENNKEKPVADTKEQGKK